MSALRKGSVAGRGSVPSRAPRPSNAATASDRGDVSDPVTTMLGRLTQGCVMHEKRWSGDTFADSPTGEVDEAATDALMAEAAALIARLGAALRDCARLNCARQPFADPSHAKYRPPCGECTTCRARAALAP